MPTPLHSTPLDPASFPPMTDVSGLATSPSLSMSADAPSGETEWHTPAPPSGVLFSSSLAHPGSLLLLGSCCGTSPSVAGGGVENMGVSLASDISGQSSGGLARGSSACDEAAASVDEAGSSDSTCLLLAGGQPLRVLSGAETASPADFAFGPGAEERVRVAQCCRTPPSPQVCIWGGKGGQAVLEPQTTLNSNSAETAKGFSETLEWREQASSKVRLGPEAKWGGLRVNTGRGGSVLTRLAIIPMHFPSGTAFRFAPGPRLPQLEALPDICQQEIHNAALFLHHGALPYWGWGVETGPHVSNDNKYFAFLPVMTNMWAAALGRGADYRDTLETHLSSHFPPSAAWIPPRPAVSSSSLLWLPVPSESGSPGRCGEGRLPIDNETPLMGSSSTSGLPAAQPDLGRILQGQSSASM